MPEPFRVPGLAVLQGLTALVTAALLAIALPATASDASSQLFQAHRPALFQIKVVDSPSSDRSALGSGFAIGTDLVATNYHVISQLFEQPEQYRILLVDKDKAEIPATLLAVDVVNDLALLRPERGVGQKLQLAQRPPAVGTTVFALGNPYDLGMSVTEGIYNGIKEGAFPRRVHYSGPVNSGMSGGPTVNAAGEVVGINVATARNSVGFLVPVDALRALQSKAGDKPLTHAAMLESIAGQLRSAQDNLTAELLAEDWPRREFGGALVPDKGATFMECWGGSDKDTEGGVDTIRRGCNSGNQVRLNGRLSTTYVEYEFAHMSTSQLGSFRLYNLGRQFFRGIRPGNRVDEDNASNEQCVEDHILVPATEGQAIRFKTLFCSRAYRKFPGLYDAIYVAMSSDREQELLFTHFTLSGFTEQNIRLFLQRFLESVQWQS